MEDQRMKNTYIEHEKKNTTTPINILANTEKFNYHEYESKTHLKNIKKSNPQKKIL